jgi:hypothetical protein
MFYPGTFANPHHNNQETVFFSEIMPGRLLTSFAGKTV